MVSISDGYRAHKEARKARKEQRNRAKLAKHLAYRDVFHGRQEYGQEDTDDV